MIVLGHQLGHFAHRDQLQSYQEQRSQLLISPSTNAEFSYILRR
ncbi:MAG: hypothetical protein AAFY50_21450 [Cyanobacteria bacterium J06648_1]